MGASSTLEAACANWQHVVRVSDIPAGELLLVTRRLGHILARVFDHRLLPAPLATVVAVVVLVCAGRHTLDHRLLPAPLATVVAVVMLGSAAAAVALLPAELPMVVDVGRRPCRMEQDVWTEL